MRPGFAERPRLNEGESEMVSDAALAPSTAAINECIYVSLRSAQTTPVFINIIIYSLLLVSPPTLLSVFQPELPTEADRSREERRWEEKGKKRAHELKKQIRNSQIFINYLLLLCITLLF